MSLKQRKKYIKGIIDTCKAIKEKSVEKVKSYVQDKSIPLNDRWEIFIESNLGNHDDWTQNPDGIDWKKVSLYDDFYCDKYAHMKVSDMLDRCIDMQNDEDEDFEFDEVKFKEYFLSKFIKSFTNDW